MKEYLSKEVDPDMGQATFMKKGKIRVVMIYEDGFYEEFFIKNKENYTLTVKKRKYILQRKYVLNGKYPTIMYYFNNPMPIAISYEESKVSALDMYEKDDIKDMKTPLKNSLGNTIVDASTIHAAMTSNLLIKMFSAGGLTLKAWLIILAGSLVILLVVLHFTGVIDIAQVLGGAA